MPVAAQGNKEAVEEEKKQEKQTWQKEEATDLLIRTSTFCLKVDLNVFSSTFTICVCGLHECLYVHSRSEDCPIFAGSSFYRTEKRFLLISFVCIENRTQAEDCKCKAASTLLDLHGGSCPLASTLDCRHRVCLADFPIRLSRRRRRVQRA